MARTPEERAAIQKLADGCIKWEAGEMNEDEEASFFQELVDMDMHTKLQGSYGRRALALMQAGKVKI